MSARVRVAALYDIHGNLPALDAVLDDVHRERVDAIVVGGDVVPGPMAREALERLTALDEDVLFIHGNCETAMLGQMRGVDAAALPAAARAIMAWQARALADREAIFASWPMTVRLDVEGVGAVLFCHGTPRDDDAIFTRETDERRLLPVLDGLGADIAVCGHTHMQFDRQVGRTRVVNAGSVGLPFGSTGAFWLLLGPGVELRCTAYDVAAAADRIRATNYPQADQFARDIMAPKSEREMLDLFRSVEERAAELR